VLTFQIVQTRILSVMVWYYMAFFAISVAMLGMTAGAVWAYLKRDQFAAVPLPATLTDFALLTAVSMPLSVLVQFCLVTEFSISFTTIAAWAILMAAMAAPYVFSGVAVSLALTRSPFPRGLVYGVDLIGASLGCFAVIALLNLLDGPTAVILAGVVAACSAAAFAASGDVLRNPRPWWKRPVPLAILLLICAVLNAALPIGLRPILVKGNFEISGLRRYEKWNSYSRIVAGRPLNGVQFLWGPSPKLPPTINPTQVLLNIDGAAATGMLHFDGTRDSISFLRYDLVTLAYRLPGIKKSAVVGVGGGRDILSAYLFGVPDITGVELNPIFINLLTKDPFYSRFSNFNAVPNVKLHVDDARSWFAATHEKFDLVQMSMIDTWAATGAGAFSLSENGLYTLEGWRAFLNALNPNGIFTVSRWYSPGDVNETGRMIGLATAALHDEGVVDARPYLFVASGANIATLVLSKSPFTPEQLALLHGTVNDLGFTTLLAPDQPPPSPLLQSITESSDIAGLNQAVQGAYLDLTVSTDNRPFFFNQLRFSRLPQLAKSFLTRSFTSKGVLFGNILASAALALILLLSLIAVVLTVLVPLRHAARESAPRLVLFGSLYFGLIGMGFMLAEIALLQRFSVFLGHPIYSLSVCLFSLILASGLGSLASDKLRLNTRTRFLSWGTILLLYLILLEQFLPAVFHATTGRERIVRIFISLGALLPLGFLFGFAFPTGLRMVEAVDTRPTPWFWGINGATGVLASVLAIMVSMAFGINATLLLAAAAYLLLAPVGVGLLRMAR
jgi:spermidine synthase